MENRLSASGKGAYCEADDHRALSEAALEKFLPAQSGRPAGAYHKFVALVLRHADELAFCLRGNSGDTATVYYKNHKAFEIDGGGRVCFDFNHARYAPDWQRRAAALQKAGFVSGCGFVPKRELRTYPSGAQTDRYTVGAVTLPAEKAAAMTFDELDALYQNEIRAMIDSFFGAAQNKTPDQFRLAATQGKERRPARQSLDEKAAQQQLFLACRSLRGGYFFYDMEFTQPHAAALGCRNKPDMLAIRFDDEGRPARLVLVEVKSKPAALAGGSGLEAHLAGMESFPDRLLAVRARDACRILTQYQRLGLLPELDGAPVKFEEAAFAGLKKEIVFVFTGQATIDRLRRPVRAGGESYESLLRRSGFCPAPAPAFSQPIALWTDFPFLPLMNFV